MSMVEVKLKRQTGNLLRVPNALWDWINVAEGEEIILSDDEGQHGRFVSFWKK